MLIFSIIGISINLNSQTYFLENKGRLPSFIQYTAQTSGGMLFFDKSGYTVLMKDTKMYDSLWEHIHKYKTLKHDFSIQWHRFDVKFIGANLVDIKTENPSITKYNFYKGNNPANWHTNLRSFGAITYLNIFYYKVFEIYFNQLLCSIMHFPLFLKSNSKDLHVFSNLIPL